VGPTESSIAPDEYHVPKNTAEATAVSLHICSGEMERCNVMNRGGMVGTNALSVLFAAPDQLTGILGLRDLRRCTTFQ